MCFILIRNYPIVEISFREKIFEKFFGLKITTLLWGVKCSFDLALLPLSTGLGHFRNLSYVIKVEKGKKIVGEQNIFRFWPLRYGGEYISSDG